MASKNICTLLVLTVFVASAFGALSRYPPGSHKSDKEGFCLFESELIKQGESLYKHCYRVSCMEDYSIVQASCGVVADNCNKWKLDASKVYPECCERICLDA